MFTRGARETAAKLFIFLYFCKHQSTPMEGSEKKYYKISEAAILLDVAQSTLRFWESEFPNLRPKRNAKGTRFYSQADMERLQMIKYLVKDRGLHLEAAKRELRVNPEGTEKKARAVTRLKEIRGRLASMLSALDALR